MFAVFIIVLVINLTPACALNIAEVQNKANYVNNYTHADFWYKFWHFVELTNVFSTLLSDLIDTANEVPSYTQQGMEISKKAINHRNELDKENSDLKALSEYYNNNPDKSNWINNSDEAETTNNKDINTNNGLNNTQLSNKTNLNYNSHNNSHNNHQNNIHNNTLNNAQNNSKYFTNKSAHPSKHRSIVQGQNITKNEKINKTNPKDQISNPPEKLFIHANQTKQQLKNDGINVNINNRTITDLKQGDIVQIISQNGYIKYMEYLGKLNHSENSINEIMLYSGDSKPLYINLLNFKKAYTGIILELSKNNPGVTSEDVVYNIYTTKLNNLNKKISDFNSYKETGLWIGVVGIFIAGIGTILGIIVGAVGLFSAVSGIGLVIAIILGTILATLAGLGVFMSVLGGTIAIVCNKNLDDSKSEKDDLTQNVV